MLTVGPGMAAHSLGFSGIATVQISFILYFFIHISQVYAEQGGSYTGV